MEHLERLEPYSYRWTEDCFPLGADSLALGGFCSVSPRDRVLDLGCGAGLLLLLCARREGSVSLFGVEAEPHAAALARENLADNGLAGEIVTGDLRQVSFSDPMDLVISNPPWYPGGSGGAGGPGRMEGCPLPALCRAAAQTLKPRGRFALVYTPGRLAELLCALRESGLEPKRLQFCRGRPDKPPYALLVEAVKDGRPGMDILPDKLPQDRK